MDTDSRTEDAQLAAEVVRGDTRAQGIFYARFKIRLLKAATYFLGYKDQEVEDVVQETFLIAYSKLAQYDPQKAGLYTWMAHICTNLCYERIRKRGRNLLVGELEMTAACNLVVLLRHQAVDKEKEKESLIHLIREKIVQLGDDCRRMITLRDLEGKSYIDISREVRVPMGTVMSRLARCRSSLRKLVLKDAGGEGL